MALKYLKNTKADISNVLIMIENFNIRDNIWDFNFLYYSIYSDLLMNIADAINLELSKYNNQVSTKYLNN